VNLQFKSRGIPEVTAWLRTVAAGFKNQALKAFADYLIGDDSHGLAHYPAYKYVTPFRSYSMDPKKAAKQRGWIFTHLDQIGHSNRTGATSKGWKYTPGEHRFTISNATKGAYYTMGDASQTRHQAAVGWRKMMEVVAANFNGAIRHAQAKVNEWIKSKGRG
jgi:hypothetical protein